MGGANPLDEAFGTSKAPSPLRPGSPGAAAALGWQVWRRTPKSIRIDSNLHALQDLQIFVGKISFASCFARFVITLIRAQGDFQTQGQLHIITSLAQAIDSLCHAGRVFDCLIDRRADLLNDLLCSLINIQTGSAFV